MAYKTFQDGEVLPAVDVQLLMDQTVIHVVNEQAQNDLPPMDAGTVIYRQDLDLHLRRVTGRWATLTDFVTVSDEAARDKLPAHAGLVVYVRNPGVTQRWTGTEWRATRRMFVARRTSTQNIGAAGWFVVAGALGVQRNDGIGTFDGGVLTFTEPGLYRVSGRVYLTSASNPNAVELTKNSPTPNATGSLASCLINASGNGGATIDAVADFVAGDQLRLLAYASAQNSIDAVGTRGAQLIVEKVD